MIMNRIKISDVTMKQAARGLSLSFKEKIELAKLLDKLDVSVIELEGIRNSKIDSLRVKSIASAVQNAVLAVPVQLDGHSVEETWNALRFAKHPRLQVCAPVSSVQMEYLYHKKPGAMLEAVCDTIEACKAVCVDVEFVVDDATRSDPAFLAQILAAAAEKGANTITVCDGKISFSDSDCPGQDCVHSGSIGSTGRSLVCLPNAVEIRVVSGESDVDFVVG